MRMPKLILLMISFATILGARTSAWANQDVSKSHVDEALNLEHKDKMKLLAMHLDPNAFNPDYRFQRDAAVVAVGCGTISSMLFPNHATKCYKKGWTAIRSGKLKFGTLINIVCSHVHETLPKSDGFPILSYEDCMENLADAFPEPTKGLIQGQIDDCQTYGLWGFDYIDKTKQCYQSRVPDIEQPLENFQKGQVFTIADEKTESDSDEGLLSKEEVLFVDDIPETDVNPDTAKAGAVRKVITQDFPPRSFWDRQKLDALEAACTSMNTDQLNPDEIMFARKKTIKRMESLLKSDRLVDVDDKKKLIELLGNQTPHDYVMSQPNITKIFLSPYEKSTFSWWRDDHCYADGFYSMALGANLPNTLYNACKGRLPGAQLDIRTNLDLTLPNFHLPKLARSSTGAWGLTKPRLEGGSIKFEKINLENWADKLNIIDFIDHKTTCLKAGVRNIDMRPYQDIIKDSGSYWFESFINLKRGLLDNNNVYEEKLKLKNRTLIRQQLSTQIGKPGLMHGVSMGGLAEEAAILEVLKKHPEIIEQAAKAAKEQALNTKQKK